MGLPLRAWVYISGIFVLALLASVYYLPKISWTEFSITLLILFGIISFFFQIYEVELIHRHSTSASIALCVAAILLAGAPVAVAVVLASTLLAEIILRWPKLANGVSAFLSRVLFNTSQIILSVSLAAIFFDLVGGHPPPYNTVSDYLPALIAFGIYTLTNEAQVAGIISLTEGISFKYHLLFYLKHLPAQLASLGVLAVLIAVLYQQAPANIALVLIPLVLVHISLRGYMRLRRGATKAIEAVSQMLAERDPYTAKHSEEVAELSAKIARKMGLPEDQVELIKAAARVHDIGKIGIPDNILLRPGPLTPEEWEILKQHPIRGAEVLRELEVYEGAVEMVLHEHENWDGSGYPYKLKGEQIPLGARIIHAADVYNALTTDRPYRKAWGEPIHYEKEQALEMIKGMSGKELDPKVVEALLKAVCEL